MQQIDSLHLSIQTGETNQYGEPILARIDNDGRVLGLFGRLPWLDSVEEHDFAERRRFPLDIVLLDGKEIGGQVEIVDTGEDSDTGERLLACREHVGEQFIAEDNDFTIDGVLTFDAMASYTWRDLLLELNIRNLTNREYNQRGFGDSSVTPADPITVYFGLTYRR